MAVMLTGGSLMASCSAADNGRVESLVGMEVETSSLLDDSCVVAEAENMSVLGIEFGIDYDEVKAVLEKRYGADRVNISDDGGLVIENVGVGRFFFHDISFGFQWDGENGVFNEASFLIEVVDDPEGAKRMRDELRDEIWKSDKYGEERTWTDARGWKNYLFFDVPKDEGGTLLCQIAVLDWGPNDGWHNDVLLKYGPFDFLGNGSDF